MTETLHPRTHVTVATHDHPYQRVAFQGDRLTACMRAAADWLDDAERGLGENLFVAAIEQTVDDEGWEFSLFVYVDEFEGATRSSGVARA